MAVIGEMDVFTVNKDKQYEVVDRKSRQSIEKINKDVNNSNKDVTAGKVWKSTSEGAGWADSDSMSDNQSGGVDITINGVKRTLQKYDETPDSMADNENGGVDITIGGTKKTVAKQADLKEIEKSQNELKSEIGKLSEDVNGLKENGTSGGGTIVSSNDINVTKWKGKKIVVDGSSITRGGTGETQPTWSDYLKDFFGLDTIYNHAVSGTGWTTSGTTIVSTRMTEYETDADAVILMGDYNGIYGYTQGAGTIDDEPSSSGSYYARLKYIAEYLINKYPLCPIIWVVEPPRSNPSDEELSKTPMGYDSSYAKQSKCIEEVAELYGFTHCNLMKNTVFRPWIQANYNVTTADGTHPYNIIQHTMAQVIAETMKRTPLLYGYKAPDTPIEPDVPEVTLSSISATYTGGEVAVGTALTDLTGITVTGTYSDGSTSAITGYTLSGEIVEGTNTITVSYSGLTTTFTVTGVAEEEEELTILYQAQNKTFNASSDDTIDTGIAPFVEDRSYTIAMKFTPNDQPGVYRRVFEIGTDSYPVMCCNNQSNGGYKINHSIKPANDCYTVAFATPTMGEEKKVVMVHNKGELKNTLYYVSNGELTEYIHEIPNLFVSTGNLILGNKYNKQTSNNAYFFKGTISDFTFYRGVLDESSIKTYLGVS